MIDCVIFVLAHENVCFAAKGCVSIFHSPMKILGTKILGDFFLRLTVYFLQRTHF